MSKGTELREAILSSCDEYGLWSPEDREPSLTAFVAAEALAWEMVKAGELVALEADIPIYCLSADLWKYRALGLVYDLKVWNQDQLVTVRNILDEGLLSFRGELVGEVPDELTVEAARERLEKMKADRS